MVGGVLGVLMMIPLRRSLIVQEHANLPYPEGTACASVLIAGEKGGNLARTAYFGLGVAGVYALLQRVLRVIVETPALVFKQTNRYLPAAVISGDITPEYLGVGYIIGPRIAGVLVAGGVLAWLGLIPLITVLTPPDRIAAQLVKLGYLASVGTPGGPGGWDPATHTFASAATAVYRAYVRQIGAGRGRRRWLHHAAQDAADHRLVVPREPRVAAPPRRGRRRGAAHRARPADHASCSSARWCWCW